MNNIIITTCDEPYYESCLSLISSIHKYNKDVVDGIFVYNLNLNKEHVDYLNTLYKVHTVEYPEYLTRDIYPDYLKP